MDNQTRQNLVEAVQSFKIKEDAKVELKSFIDDNFTDIKNELISTIRTAKEQARKAQMEEDKRREMVNHQNYHSFGEGGQR